MPVYDQYCASCDREFEIIVLGYDAPRPCPGCGSLDTEQLVSVPNFRIAARKFEIKRGPSHNPYQNLVLQHVRGHDGKPIVVNSEAELHRAEKEHGFVHAATWGLEKEPPQHEKWAGQIDHNYKRKWARDPAAYVRPEAKKGVSTGVTDSADKTLAALPNPM